jgi:ubiquinone/menaquinone biosynthesis C-methylase UbiE
VPDTRKHTVKTFYDGFGWNRPDNHTYGMSIAWDDTRPIAIRYRVQANLRVARFLRRAGRYLLDAGSGAVPHDEYLTYSSKYEKRICVDISSNGLREARKRLGSHGWYVVADVSNLPFKDSVFDSAVSSHAIYHVPEEQQKSAILEIYRTLKVGSPAIIVYINNNAPLNQFVLLLQKIDFTFRPIVQRCLHRLGLLRKSSNKLTKLDYTQNSGNDILPIYCHFHDPRWFAQEFGGFDLEIRSHSLVGKRFTSKLVPDNPIGRTILRIITLCDELFPHLSSTIAFCFMVIMRKH